MRRLPDPAPNYDADVTAADLLVAAALRVEIEKSVALDGAKRMLRHLLELHPPAAAVDDAVRWIVDERAAQLRRVGLDPDGDTAVPARPILDAALDAWENGRGEQANVPASPATPRWDVDVTVRVRARNRAAAATRMRRWARELERRGSVESVELYEPRGEEDD